MIDTFHVYDSACSNTLAYAAFFIVSRRMVLDGCDEDGNYGFEVVTLPPDKTPLAFLQEHYKTIWIFDGNEKRRPSPETYSADMEEMRLK